MNESKSMKSEEEGEVMLEVEPKVMESMSLMSISTLSCDSMEDNVKGGGGGSGPVSVDSSVGFQVLLTPIQVSGDRCNKRLRLPVLSLASEEDDNNEKNWAESEEEDDTIPLRSRVVSSDLDCQDQPFIKQNRNKRKPRTQCVFRRVQYSKQQEGVEETPKMENRALTISTAHSPILSPGCPITPNNNRNRDKISFWDDISIASQTSTPPVQSSTTLSAFTPTTPTSSSHHIFSQQQHLCPPPPPFDIGSNTSPIQRPSSSFISSFLRQNRARFMKNHEARLKNFIPLQNAYPNDINHDAVPSLPSLPSFDDHMPSANTSHNNTSFLSANTNKTATQHHHHHQSLVRLVRPRVTRKQLLRPRSPRFKISRCHSTLSASSYHNNKPQHHPQNLFNSQHGVTTDHQHLSFDHCHS